MIFEADPGLHRRPADQTEFAVCFEKKTDSYPDCYSSATIVEDVYYLLRYCDLRIKNERERI
jgi:hypothetical protein